ncbi:hypothetical protein [Microbacterium sp. 11MF]|nr:hypothetical protein [Microbacterium sp. 11MF]
MDPQHIVTIVVAIIGLLGIVVTFIGTRGKTKTDAKTALDARIDARVAEQLEGAWTKIGSLEGRVNELVEKDRLKSSAFARILRAIARQWPSDHGPDLDPSDIALIEDTIPPTWLRRQKETS